MRAVIWKGRLNFLGTYFWFDNKQKVFEETKYAKFCIVNKETFSTFFFFHHEAGWFFRGPRLSKMLPFSIKNNPHGGPKLNNGNLDAKSFLGLKVFCEWNKTGRCICKQFQFLNINFRNIHIVEISDLFSHFI